MTLLLACTASLTTPTATYTLNPGAAAILVFALVVAAAIIMQVWTR